MKRLKLNAAGIVQGVGFRPFIYNLARRLQLGGFILNNADGVEIEVEGEKENVSAFITALTKEAPPLSVISDIKIQEIANCGERSFAIKNSAISSIKTALVSPDIATCPECQKELSDDTDRRCYYPFINCTNCGPRFSIIKDVPYDRPATTMADFIMCSDCQEEYNNPADRRFHAQPNACVHCGPVYSLLDRNGVPVSGITDALEQTRKLADQGAVIAIKGIGGYHLTCLADNEQAVELLRKRKVREDKPFAVMCGSLKAVERICLISPSEASLLTGTVRPIVLLEKRQEYNLARGIAPNNPRLGVMLPYAPIHFLLIKPDEAWVMTSGNTSDEPIAYDDQDALDRLGSIADYFLVHNRPIYRRVDDSVVRVIKDKPYILRRSRGLVPLPIVLASDTKTILATGAELKNSFCLTRGSQAFMSSHIGDLENLATYNSYVETIEHFKKLFSIKPEAVAYDLHPEYLATKYALSLNLPKVGVQHHHAHIAAVLAENGITDKVIGVAFDGTGYGTDGNLWGGEFLITDCGSFERAGHCRYMRLPGGAKAIKEPWRLALWMLYELYGKGLAKLDIPFTRNLPSSWELAADAAGKGLNSPLSSGVGRLFDAAGALLGLRNIINYEGQAAVELELAAAGQEGTCLPYDISQDSNFMLDFRPTFAALTEGLRKGQSQQYLAAAFHTTIAAATVDMIRRISKASGIKRTALSGGVWQNITLLNEVLKLLDNEGFECYIHRQVPPNDGGLALGQAIVANEALRSL